MRTSYCGDVSEALMGQEVTLMGWAHRRRDHGGVIFIDLRLPLTPHPDGARRRTESLA